MGLGFGGRVRTRMEEEEELGESMGFGVGGFVRVGLEVGVPWVILG